MTGWPARASPRSAWSPRTPPATARTWAAARPWSTCCATWPGSTACAGSGLNYLQPDELTAGLLEEMAANPVVCSYFDLSLQHASAPVLRRMRRGGSAGAFLDLVARIRALDPDAAFRSNFILGFPGERQADVRELEAFLEAARLDWVVLRLVARGRHRRPRPGRPRPGGHRQGPGRAGPGAAGLLAEPSRPGSGAGSRCWSSGSRTAPPRAAASGRPRRRRRGPGRGRAPAARAGSTCRWWSPPPRARASGPAGRVASSASSARSERALRDHRGRHRAAARPDRQHQRRLDRPAPGRRRLGLPAHGGRGQRAAHRRDDHRGARGPTR